MSGMEPEQRRAYRNLLALLGRGGLLFALGGTIIISMVLYVTHLPHYRNAVDVRYGTAAGVLAAGLIAWALAVRVFRSGIVVSPDGVLIRHAVHRRQFVSWPEVTGFDVIAAPRFINMFTRTPVAVAVLRVSGSPLYCVGSSFSEPSSYADKMADRLNEVRRSSFAGLPEATG